MDPNVPHDQNPYQPPQGAPGVPPPWGQPAPTTSGGSGAAIGRFMRSVVGRIVGGLVVLGIIGGATFIYQKVANPDHLSQIVFTSTDQTSNDGCKVTDRVSTTKAGAPVYLTVMWSHRMSASDKITQELFKDGVSIDKSDNAWDPSDYAGYDCYVDTTNLATDFNEPGSWEIKLTVGSDVVADGTLTVTP